jgi:phosphate transport system regulatory protein PhoU
MTRNAFNESLQTLNEKLIEMGVLTEKAIDDAIIALKKDDKILAKRVFDSDDDVDIMEKEIETMCINIIATQQPIAGDLRMITAILKMITDLERIADHAADICEIILVMDVKKDIFDLEPLEKMAGLAKSMVKDSITAYIKRDLQLAKEVCDRDEKIDNLFHKVVFMLQNLMALDKANIPVATDYIFIIKYLERVGDHTTNIAEWVIFNLTGKHESSQ